MSTASGGATPFSGGVTSVECEKQVRSWRLLRALAQFLIPSCNPHHHHRHHQPPHPTTTRITIFGYRQGKVKLCIQIREELVLLELGVPTATLGREMAGGVLRIALEQQPEEQQHVWSMYCNGRRVGFAVRRRPSKSDMDVLLKIVRSSSSTGILKTAVHGVGDSIMYLRGSFERVRASPDAESFHLIDDPDDDDNVSQDLSIFFLRRRRAAGLA